MKRFDTARLRTLFARIDALSLRERLLLLFILLGVLWLTFDRFWIAPAWEGIERERQAVGAAESRIASLQAALREIARGEDPVARREAEIAALQERLREGDRALEDRLGALPRPFEVPRLLRALLGTGGMRLIALVTEPDADGPFEDEAGLGREVRVRGYRLELEGGYFDALDYVRQLERMPWALYQDQVRYEAGEWPRGRLRLRLIALEQGR